MDAEVAHAAVQQQRAHRVGHRADPDLQARSVLDLGRDEAGDLTIDVGGHRLRKLRKRQTGTVDDVVDLADVQPVVDAVDVRDGGVDLDDDDLRA